MKIPQGTIAESVKTHGLAKQPLDLLPGWKKNKAQLVKQEFSTVPEFVIGNNFEAMSERFSKISRREMIANDTFNLLDLKLIYTWNTPQLLIEACLVYLNTSVNFKEENKLSDAQVKILGRQLLTILGSITMAELWLFFDQVMSGHFGVFYNNIDPISLATWARQYMSDRGNLIMKDKELMIFIRDRNWQWENQQKHTSE